MPRHIESQIQRSCKKWFDYQYGQFAPLLFAVPNGGLRGQKEAQKPHPHRRQGHIPFE